MGKATCLPDLLPWLLQKEMNKFGTNSAIFLLFFGVALLDAFQTQNWLRVVLWVLIGLVFLYADLRKP
jgi:cell division protein FtsW (lipid II flippase)